MKRSKIKSEVTFNLDNIVYVEFEPEKLLTNYKYKFKKYGNFLGFKFLKQREGWYVNNKFISKNEDDLSKVDNLRFEESSKGFVKSAYLKSYIIIYYIDSKMRIKFFNSTGEAWNFYKNLKDKIDGKNESKSCK